MHGRFPGDVAIIVFGPLFVAAIALSMSWIILHVAQWSGSLGLGICAGVAALGFFVILVILLWRRRRDHT
jgi:hypothetical protein